MQLSIFSLALLALISGAASAPVATAAAPTLIARGQGDEADSYIPRLKCLSSQIPECFKREVQEDLQDTESDLAQDFSEWKHDMAQDVEMWKTQLSKAIQGFDVRYTSFKTAVKRAVRASTGGVVVLPKESLRFHLAYVSESLATLQDDIRGDVSEALVGLSIALHEGCDAAYTPYPAGCDTVLTQIETIERFYRTKIDITQYNTQLVRLHSIILAHITPDLEDSLPVAEPAAPECSKGDMAKYNDELAEFAEWISECSKEFVMMGTVNVKRPSCAPVDIAGYKDALADLHEKISECTKRKEESEVETYQGFD